MSRRHSTCALLVPVVVVLSAVLATNGAEPAAPEELPRITPPADHYLGALSCASASCHGRQDEQIRSGSVSRQEYTVWLEHDPHAKAARTLEGERFQRILRIVSSGRADGQPDAQVTMRCAKCHDPQGVASAGGSADDLLAGKNIVARGIGCESCHGPAKNWIAVHYERDVTREQLVELGMIDTKNLVVRAEQCAGCHVGDADKDMNHDMIAAGHPPLRFELSAYHDLIHQKHWPAAERVRTPEFKAQLWAAGQVAVARSSLALLESRAKRAVAGDKATPWPEFAEYDCFACHQRLRPAAGFSSMALKGTKPGVPGWQPWNLALAERLLADVEAGPALGAVRAYLGESLVADPAKTAELAAAAHKNLVQDPLRPPRFTTASLLALLELAIQEEQSWAARSQQLLALRAGDLLARDERLRLQPPAGFASVTSGREERRSEPVDDWDRDWRSVAAALRFGSPKFEWPAFDWEGLGVRESSSLPPMSGDQIAENLQRLADELRHRSESTAP